MDTTVLANKGGPKKIDIKKQGLNTVQNKIVKNNLMGVSDSMNKKDWRDSQGRKGKVGHVVVDNLSRQPLRLSALRHVRWFWISSTLLIWDGL